MGWRCSLKRLIWVLAIVLRSRGFGCLTLQHWLWIVLVVLWGLVGILWGVGSDGAWDAWLRYPASTKGDVELPEGDRSDVF